MHECPKLQKRFWEKVEKRGPDECWPWLAMVNIKGHGKFQVGHRQSDMAHRVMYEMTYNAIPDGIVVRHKCHQPDCVNPAHLCLGTIADNAADRVERGWDEPRKPRLGVYQPSTYKTPTVDFKSRLLAGYKVMESGCWEWQKGKESRGYGVISFGRKTYKAHRMTYEHFVGPIPVGMFILHKCDNRSCVNPDHLRPGTHKENMAEMAERGGAKAGLLKRSNQSYARGETIAKSVLTEDAVRQIRTCSEPYKFGASIGVHKATICHVLARRTWKHVE